jgi:hypothetical protein
MKRKGYKWLLEFSIFVSWKTEWKTHNHLKIWINNKNKKKNVTSCNKLMVILKTYSVYLHCNSLVDFSSASLSYKHKILEDKKLRQAC